MLAGGALTQLPAVDGQPLAAYASVLTADRRHLRAIPSIVTTFSRLAARPMQRLLGTEAMLALRSLRASLGRTSVLTAALTTAVAMTASVGIMVGSFRQTVSVWMDNQLTADFYLRPAGDSSADRHPTMAASHCRPHRPIPGVASVDRFRAYPDFVSRSAGHSRWRRIKHRTHFLPGEDSDEILRTVTHRRLRRCE